MNITRFVSACFALLSVGLFVAGCGASVLPPAGSVPTDKSCSAHIQCNNVKLPPCMLNVHFCYQGKCQIKPDPTCTPPATTATAVSPAGTPALSPSIEPAPAPAPG